MLPEQKIFNWIAYDVFYAPRALLRLAIFIEAILLSGLAGAIKWLESHHSVSSINTVCSMATKSNKPYFDQVVKINKIAIKFATFLCIKDRQLNQPFSQQNLPK